jgi:hypothetical protein
LFKINYERKSKPGQKIRITVKLKEWANLINPFAGGKANFSIKPAFSGQTSLEKAREEGPTCAATIRLFAMKVTRNYFFLQN